MQYTTSEEWTELSTRLTVPDAGDSESGQDTESMYLCLGFYAPDNTGIAYYDRAVIVPAE